MSSNVVKRCPDCSTEKHAGDFCKNSHRKDGLSLYCRECSKIRKRVSARLAAGRQATKRAVAKYQQKYPEKKRAHILARSIPLSGICQKEGCTAVAEIRHHPDYAKPLEVELLCKSCHYKEHEYYAA